MVFTTVQQYIMKLLKTFRCLRDDQIDRLVCAEMKYKPEYALRQRERILNLCSHMVRRPLDGYTGMNGAEADNDLIAAMDVMLMFLPQRLAAYRRGKPPFKLAFVKEDPNGQLRAYYVAVVRMGMELILSEQAQCAYKGRGNVVLFLLEDIQQAEAIDVPFEHYYVVREEDGFQFFEGEPVSDGE